MIIKKSRILGLKQIYPQSIYQDVRGVYIESFSKKHYKKK
jgi:hypothetical protein